MYNEWNHTKLFSRYLRITDSGEIEYAETMSVFDQWKDTRFFRFVQVTGLTFQLMTLFERILLRHNYLAGAHMTFCLVGTRETIPSDFSQEPGEDDKHWRDPVKEAFYFSDKNRYRINCTDPNIKISYDFVIGNLDESACLTIIKDLGTKLGLAYNHQSTPRCFNYNTDVFPRKQFLAGRR